jgi:hypothetical protein
MQVGLDIETSANCKSQLRYNAHNKRFGASLLRAGSAINEIELVVGLRQKFY